MTLIIKWCYCWLKKLTCIARISSTNLKQFTISELYWQNLNPCLEIHFKETKLSC